METYATLLVIACFFAHMQMFMHVNMYLVDLSHQNILAMLSVGYREKGYPKQDPKNDCLDFVKIETSKTLLDSDDSPTRPRPPRRRPPLSSQASAGPLILRLARGRLGSTPLPLPSPVPLTRRRVTSTQPTAVPDNSRTHRHSTAEWPMGQEAGLGRGDPPLY